VIEEKGGGYVCGSWAMWALDTMNKQQTQIMGTCVGIWVRPGCNLESMLHVVTPPAL